ncbi:MAG: serine/threonine protein kinase [Desulfobacteraceae bacterium]|nr:MAG: serine/threonine protein kinase [Desulfobacteraceae bacterium]
MKQRKMTQAMFEFKGFKKWLVKYLAFWVSFIFLVYGCLQLYRNHAQNDIHRSGVLLSKQISSLITPPLLKKDFQNVHVLIDDFIKRADVAAYVVLDSDNKIVTSAAKDSLCFSLTQMPSMIILDDVFSKEIRSSASRKLICFSSGIRSSGAQIGQLHFSLHASKLNHIETGFTALYLFSVMILLWPVGVWVYVNRHTILRWPLFGYRIPIPNFSFLFLLKNRLFRQKKTISTSAEITDSNGNNRLSKTIWWIKQFSTITFLHLYRKILEREAISRNKKQISLCLAVWFLINLGAFYIYHTSVSGLYSAFYRKGYSLTYGLADKIGMPLLQEDLLRMNMAVGDYGGEPRLLSVIIVDHQGKIVAHTEPAMITHSLPPLKNAETVKIMEGTLFEYGLGPDERTVFHISRDIRFLDEKIGKVYFVFSSELLHGPIRRYRLFLMIGFLFNMLLSAAIIAWIIRTSKAKALQSQKRMEGLTKIGPYILLNKIGQGGMAELFLADYLREDGFRKIVAIKKIRPHLAEHPDFIKMFIHEARVAALLRHPNIVQTIDFGSIENVYFMAMEYVEGKNLGEILTRFGTGLSMAQSMYIISKIARGLDYSHSKKDDTTGEPLNVVHCDISLENILVSFQGEVKISDFGISRAAIGGTRPLAHDDTIKGKLAYLTPEQVLGKPINHQTDLYSLGLVSYTLLTGKIAQNFKSEMDALKTIPKMDIPPINEIKPELPMELNDIVMKCLAKDREHRYQHAQELHDDLTHLKNKLHINYDESDIVTFMQTHFSKERRKTVQTKSGDSPPKIISLN